MSNKRTLISPGLEAKGPFPERSLSKRFRLFMENLWADPAEYKVLLARRMMNLNDALMREWNIEQNEQYSTDGIMSNTAFLLSANTIADYYAYKNQFPRIIICDDIMLHGRGILILINRFRQIVLHRLAEIDVVVNERKLGTALYKSLRIYVFARNEDKGILIDDKEYRLLLTLQ